MRGGGKLLMVAEAGLGLVALLLVGFAFLGGNGGESAAVEPQAAQSAPVTIVTSMRDVPAHTILPSENLYEESVPTEAVAADAVRAKAQTVGQGYREPLIKDQRLLSGGIEQPGMANDIAPGKRAMSLPVGTANLLPGLVQDDDYVDDRGDQAVSRAERPTRLRRRQDRVDVESGQRRGLNLGCGHRGDPQGRGGGDPARGSNAGLAGDQ